MSNRDPKPSNISEAAAAMGLRGPVPVDPGPPCPRCGGMQVRAGWRCVVECHSSAACASCGRAFDTALPVSDNGPTLTLQVRQSRARSVERPQRDPELTVRMPEGTNTPAMAERLRAMLGVDSTTEDR